MLALLGILVGLGWPALHRQIVRSRLEGFSNQVSVLVQKARMEAVRRRAVAVVEVDPADRRVFAYVDLDGPAVGTPPDLELNPVAGERRFTTDFLVGSLPLEQNLDAAAPMGQPAVDGFSDSGRGVQVAVIRPDGGLEAVGGFRFADQARLNFLEVRIEPAATARVELRKWDPDAGAWRARREGGEPWRWRI